VAFIIRRTWGGTPPDGARVDWSNPLTDGLRLLFAPRSPNTQGADGLLRATASGVGSTYAAGSFRGLSLEGRLDAFLNGKTFNIPVTELNTAFTASGQASVLALCRAEGTDSSGNLSLFRLKNAGGFNEHYPDNSNLIYMQPFAAARWINGVSSLVTITQPHVFVATHRSGAQVAYQNGRVLTTGSRVETPGLTTGAGFGGNGTLYLAAIWNRILTPTEVVQLSDNPYQLFEHRRIFFPVSAAGGGGVTVSVPAASLALTANAPTVTATANQTIAVPTAALSLTSFAPTVLQSQLVQVPAAALTLTAYAPTVTATANRFVNPPAAAMTLTGFAPSVLASGGNVVNVPAAGLTMTGHVPTVTATANQAIAVPAGSLTLTGFAPSVLSGSSIAVPAGSLTLTGFAPSVVTTTNSFVSVPAAALALTGYAPTVSNGVSAIPTMPPYITVFLWRRTA
jgi:hypothetical protein